MRVFIIQNPTEQPSIVLNSWKSRYTAFGIGETMARLVNTFMSSPYPCLACILSSRPVSGGKVAVSITFLS